MLTTAFVSDARSFIRRTSRPLLASPSQVAQTLHWYDSAEAGYLLSLGEWTIDPPPVPTWREFFISQDIAHQTEKDAQAIWEDHLIWPREFVATRDRLLVFGIGSGDTDRSEVSGANSTTPQGGPGAADAASGLLLNSGRASPVCKWATWPAKRSPNDTAQQARRRCRR